MPDYLSVGEIPEAECISIALYLEAEELVALGERLNAVCDEAYMNGYNWDAVLTAYLEQFAPDLLEDLESDPEAGMYAAEYPLNDNNREKARRLGELLVSLVSDPQKLCDFVAENADGIEWD